MFLRIVGGKRGSQACGGAAAAGWRTHRREGLEWHDRAHLGYWHRAQVRCRGKRTI